MLDELEIHHNPIVELGDYLSSHNLSKNEFSKICGVPSATICEIMSLKRRPSAQVAKKISIETDIDPLNLIVYFEIQKARQQLDRVISEQN